MPRRLLAATDPLPGDKFITRTSIYYESFTMSGTGYNDNAVSSVCEAILPGQALPTSWAASASRALFLGIPSDRGRTGVVGGPTVPTVEQLLQTSRHSYSCMLAAPSLLTAM